MAVFGVEMQGYLSISAVPRREGTILLFALKTDHVQGGNFTYGYSQV